MRELRVSGRDLLRALGTPSPVASAALGDPGRGSGAAAQEPPDLNLYSCAPIPVPGVPSPDPPLPAVTPQLPFPHPSCSGPVPLPCQFGSHSWSHSYSQSVIPVPVFPVLLLYPHSNCSPVFPFFTPSSQSSCCFHIPSLIPIFPALVPVPVLYFQSHFRSVFQNPGGSVP